MQNNHVQVIRSHPQCHTRKFVSLFTRDIWSPATNLAELYVKSILGATENGESIVAVTWCIFFPPIHVSRRKNTVAERLDALGGTRLHEFCLGENSVVCHKCCHVCLGANAMVISWLISTTGISEMETHRGSVHTLTLTFLYYFSRSPSLHSSPPCPVLLMY